MNRRIHDISPWLVVLCLFGMPSCSKILVGEKIFLTAKSHFFAPTTKTVYSNETYTDGGDTYERIDWVDGDRIKLCVKNDDVTGASHVYAIDTPQPASRFSIAGLTPEGGNGLQWGNGTHYFWSAYPSTATTGTYTVSGTYPEVQNLTFVGETDGVLMYEPDMDYAYMVAGLKTDPTDDGISLDFYPAMTTFEFTVRANDNLVITGFEMETNTAQSMGVSSGLDLSGTFVATFDPADNMSYTFSNSGTTGHTLSANFSALAAISPTKSMRFKLFALPQDITGVRLVFTLNNGTTRSLKLTTNTDQWITFSACSLVRITGLLVPGAVWNIEMDGPRVQQWIVNSEIEIGVE